MLSSLTHKTLRTSSDCVQRPERAAVLQSLRSGEMVLVVAPQSSGLTTLLAEVADLGLNQRFVATSYISGNDLQSLNPGECFAAVLSRLSELLPLGWQAPECTDQKGFRRALLHILALLPQQVVLVLDDLQAAPPAWRESWLSLLRGINHEKQFQPFWQKFSCLLGTHTLTLNAAASLSFLSCYRMQPVGQAELARWLTGQPELESSTEASLAISAWAGGNPVWAECLLRLASEQGFAGPADVAYAAARWVESQPTPDLPDAAQALLQEVAAFGPRPACGLPEEQLLVDLAWLREHRGQLHWSAPLMALRWKTANLTTAQAIEQPWLLLDQQRMEVRHLGSPLSLHPQELKILFLLASQPGRFFSADAIYRQITDDASDTIAFSVNVRAQIARLRRKLPSPDYLETRRNVGYAFNSQLPFQLKKA